MGPIRGATIVTSAITWALQFAVFRFARAFVKELGDDDIFGVAAEMAYRFLFSIFPLLLFLVVGLGLVGNAIGLDNLFDNLLLQVEPFVPGAIMETLDEYVTGLLASGSAALLGVALLGAIWGASGGVNNLIKGLNRAYDVDQQRPPWMRFPIAIAATILVPASGAIVAFLAVAGRDLARWLGSFVGMSREAADLLALTRWPLILILFFLGLSLMYWILPNVSHKFYRAMPGAAFGTVAWLALTQGLGIYIENLSSYNTTYGSIGTVIVLMLWLYLIGVVVLIGAEVNALLEPSQWHKWRPPPIPKPKA